MVVFPENSSVSGCQRGRLLSALWQTDRNLATCKCSSVAIQSWRRCFAWLWPDHFPVLLSKLAQRKFTHPRQASGRARVIRMSPRALIDMMMPKHDARYVDVASAVTALFPRIHLLIRLNLPTALAVLASPRCQRSRSVARSLAQIIKIVDEFD